MKTLKESILSDYKIKESILSDMDITLSATDADAKKVLNGNVPTIKDFH